MKFTTALLLLSSLVSTVVAPGNKVRSHVVRQRQGPPEHANGRGRCDEKTSYFEISYTIQYPTRYNFVNEEEPFQNPGDQALFDDDVYAEDQKTVIGRIYGYCILTDAPNFSAFPSDENSGSTYCQTPLSLDAKVNGRRVKGTFTTAGVILNPVGLPNQPAAEGVSAITGGTGDFKYAQGTVELKQLDQEWISEKAFIRIMDVGEAGTSW